MRDPQHRHELACLSTGGSDSVTWSAAGGGPCSGDRPAGGQPSGRRRGQQKARDALLWAWAGSRCRCQWRAMLELPPRPIQHTPTETLRHWRAPARPTACPNPSQAMWPRAQALQAASWRSPTATWPMTALTSGPRWGDPFGHSADQHRSRGQPVGAAAEVPRHDHSCVHAAPARPRLSHLVRRHSACRACRARITSWRAPAAAPLSAGGLHRVRRGDPRQRAFRGKWCARGAALRGSVSDARLGNWAGRPVRGACCLSCLLCLSLRASRQLRWAPACM
jgi:hypothetical protein